MSLAENKGIRRLQEVEAHLSGLSKDEFVQTKGLHPGGRRAERAWREAAENVAQSAQKAAEVAAQQGPRNSGEVVSPIFSSDFRGGDVYVAGQHEATT